MILKYLKAREWGLIAICAAFIVAGVWLDLEIPDHMFAITNLIQTGGTVAWIMELIAEKLIAPADFGLNPQGLRFGFASNQSEFDVVGEPAIDVIKRNNHCGQEHQRPHTRDLLT